MFFLRDMVNMEEITNFIRQRKDALHRTDTILPPGHFIRDLSGLSVVAKLEVRTGRGKKIISFTNSTLCTHFGLSGPAVLDISRYYLAAKHDDPDTAVVINWWPEKTTEQLDIELQSLRRISVLKYLRSFLPERLARALCQHAGVAPGSSRAIS